MPYLSEEKRLKLANLFGLLLKPPTSLTEEELNEVEKYTEILSDTIHHLRRTFPDEWIRAKYHLLRKRELDKLSTKELQERMDTIRQERIQAMREDVDDTDLPDSFFGSPPIDSDRHIIQELLEERKEK